MITLQANEIDHFDRVRSFTPTSVNQKIDRARERSVEAVIAEGPLAVRKRLRELDREWHIDRVLMLNFAVLVFAQLLAARKNKKWLRGPLFQLPFLAMHAIVGWCPPSLWFRPLGFRTRQEIETEREALIFGSNQHTSNKAETVEDVNIKKEIRGNLESIVSEVTENLKAQGFGVLTRIDLHTKVKEKIGKELRPTVILGACNPQLAHEAFIANPNVASLLPCNAVIRETDNGLYSVELAKPSALMRILEDNFLTELSQEADLRLEEALRATHDTVADPSH